MAGVTIIVLICVLRTIGPTYQVSVCACICVCTCTCVCVCVEYVVGVRVVGSGGSNDV